MNAPADKVYNTAVTVMNSMFVNIKTVAKNQGTSSWASNNVSLGSQRYKEKTRFTVMVSDKGKNKSILRIARERSTNMMGGWGKASSGRFLHYEYKVLQKINAARAAKIDQQASK